MSPLHRLTKASRGASRQTPLTGTLYTPSPQQPSEVKMEDENTTEDDGSKVLGFLLGFFGGCIGLLVAIAVIKKPDTKSGAIMGFISAILLGGCMGLCVGVLQVAANS